MSENIGSKIQKLREDKGLSQEQVARMAGLSVGYLSKLEQGAETHQNPTLKTLKSIAKILEVPLYILTVEDGIKELEKGWKALSKHSQLPKKLESLVNSVKQQSSVRSLPVLGGASCGKWKDANDMDYPAGHADEFIPAPTKDPNAFIVRAQGDSMINDQIKEGDYLVIEPNTPIKNGNIVLAWDPKNGCTIKKFYKKPDGSIILVAANPKYPPIEVEPNEDFRVYRVRRKIEEL